MVGVALRCESVRAGMGGKPSLRIGTRSHGMQGFRLPGA